MAPLRYLSIGAAALCVLASACGSPGDPPTLTVFAASSLEPVFRGWEPELEGELGVDLQLSFAASSVVARQVAEGAPADVLITADSQSMNIAVTAAAIGDRTVIARNRLALVVARGNPESIADLADLARPGLRVVLCDPEVPCGRLSARLLERAGVSPAFSSLEENVGAAVGKVVLGEADATIAYVTDVRARADQVTGIDLPQADSRDLEAEYPAAIVSAGSNPDRASRLIDLLVSATGRARFSKAGFLLPLGR